MLLRFRVGCIQSQLNRANTLSRFYSRPSQHTLPPKSSSLPHSPQAPQKRLFILQDFCVTADESGMRLDRFLKNRFREFLLRQQQQQQQQRQQQHLNTALPTVTHALISKWIRTGRQVRLLSGQQPDQNPGEDGEQIVDGAEESEAKGSTRAKSGSVHTKVGQVWRVRGFLQIDVDETVKTEDAAILPTSTSIVDPDQGAEERQRIKHLAQLPLQSWVVYKDSKIIVLDKPYGVDVQGGTGVEQSIDGSLSSLQEGYPEKPRIVHRLDRSTSGLLILARTRKAAQDLARRFRDGAEEESGGDISDRIIDSDAETIGTDDTTADISGAVAGPSIQKKYVAIVASKTRISARSIEGITKTEDGLQTLQGNMVVMDKGRSQGIQMQNNDASHMDLSRAKAVWPSRTDFRIVSESFQEKRYWALLYLYPRTGRKHQLRIHCAEMLKAPILGDFKYGAEEYSKESKLRSRLHLHMAEITLKNWFQDTDVSEKEGPNHRILENGSLVLYSPLSSSMQHSIRKLGLHASIATRNP